MYPEDRGDGWMDQWTMDGWIIVCVSSHSKRRILVCWVGVGIASYQEKTSLICFRHPFGDFGWWAAWSGWLLSFFPGGACFLVSLFPCPFGPAGGGGGGGRWVLLLRKPREALDGGGGVTAPQKRCDLVAVPFCVVVDGWL